MFESAMKTNTAYTIKSQYLFIGRKSIKSIANSVERLVALEILWGFCEGVKRFLENALDNRG